MNCVVCLRYGFLSAKENAFSAYGYFEQVKGFQTLYNGQKEMTMGTLDKN